MISDIKLNLRHYYFNYWSRCIRDSIENQIVNRFDYIQDGVVNKGDKFYPFRDYKNLLVLRGQIIEYAFKISKNGELIYQFAICLDDSFEDDHEVSIVPIETKSINKDENNNSSNNLIRKFDLGVLPAISKDLIVVAKIDEVKILDKTLIKADSKFFDFIYGKVPENVVEDINNKYLTFAGYKLLKHEKENLNLPIYAC